MEKEEYVKLHRELWDWLSKNPIREKRDWPRWSYNGGAIAVADGDCFACEYQSQNDKICPEGCLFIWGEEEGDGCSYLENGTDGLWERWQNSSDLKIRTELAEKIRDLEVRED